MSAATEETAAAVKKTFPPVESLPTEWTSSRAGLVKVGVLLGVVIAAISVWAMRQPWVGMALGAELGAGQQVATADGTTQTVSASGVISAWDAVRVDEYLTRQGVDPLAVAASLAPGAPTAEVLMGLPKPTTLLLIALALIVAGFLFRNTAGFVLAVFPLQMSSAAATAIVSALTYGGPPEMYTQLDGAMWQSRAVMLGWALLALGGLYVFSINRKQRALEKVQYEAGLRESPARLTMIHMVASILVRGQLDKASEVASAGKAAT